MVALLERPTKADAAWIEILAPLIQVDSRESLDQILPHLVSRFSQVSALAKSDPTLQQIVARNKVLVKEAKNALKLKVGLLGAEASEQALGAFTSFLAFEEWLLSVQNPTPAILRFWGQIAQPLSYSVMVFNALRIILHDFIPNWKPEAAPILCGAADDLMTLIEDAFLELEMPPTDFSDAVPIKTVIG